MPGAARYGTLLAIPASIGRPIVERPGGGSNRASSPTGLIIRVRELRHCAGYTSSIGSPLWNAFGVVAMEPASSPAT